MSVDERWRALEEENTRLRNSLISSNDEIFTLRAVAASVEAEIKYSAEQELTKIGSELKFRSKELESLSKEHERVLRELKQLRQQEADNRSRMAIAPPTSTRDHGGQSQSSAESGLSQSNRAYVPQPGIRREETGPSKPPVGPISSDVGDTGHSTPLPPPPLAHLVPLCTPPSVVPELTFPATLSAQFEQFLCVIAQAGRGVNEAAEVERLVGRATAAIRAAMVQQAPSTNPASALVDAFDAVLLIGAALLRTVRSSLLGQGSALSSGTVVDAVEQTVVALGTLAPHSLLAHRHNSSDDSDPARVAGSLQSRFERAAAPSSSAKQGTAAQPPPADLVSAALVLPALTEAQRRLAVSETVQDADRRAYRDYDVNLIAQLARRYAEFLSGVCTLCGECLAADGVHDRWCRLFTTTAIAATSFYRSSASAACRPLLSRDELSNCPGTQSWDGIFGAVVEATLQLRGGCRRHRDYGVAAAAAQLWQAAIQSSDGAIAAFAAWEGTACTDASSGNRDGEIGKGSVLSVLLDGIAAPLQGDTGEAICYRCTVVQCFLMALEHCGPAFVRVFLGIAEAGTQSTGKGRQQTASRRKRGRGADEDDEGVGEGEGEGDTSSMRSGHSGSSASDLARLAAAGAGDGASRSDTPVPVRKAGSRLGRAESTVAEPVGAGAVGAATGVVRITPSTHGSGGVRSGRKVAPAVIVVDLQGQLGRVVKRHLTRCMQAWMRAVRFLDACTGMRPLSEAERQVVRLTHLLGNFLGAFLDHLKPADCDEVLSEAADVVHEYIHRCNTASWSPVLKISESLFAFLESRQQESSA